MMYSVTTMKSTMLSSLLAWAVSGAANNNIQEMMEETDRILPLIGQFSDDQSRLSLSQVNEPFREAVNKVRIKERTPVSHKRTYPYGDDDAYVPCPKSKIQKCLNEVAKWDRDSVLLTEDHMINVESVPDSILPKYNGNYQVLQHYPVLIQGVWSLDQSSEWIVNMDQSSKLQSITHVNTGSIVNLAEYAQIHFADDQLAVAISMDDHSGKYTLHLLMLIPGNPHAKVLRTIGFDPFPTDHRLLPVSFGVQKYDDLKKGTLDIKVTLRTFAKLRDNDKYRIRLTTFEMFTQSEISDVFITTECSGGYSEYPQSQANDISWNPHLMMNDGKLYIPSSKAPWLLSIEVETGKFSRVMPLVEHHTSWQFNPEFDYMIGDTEYDEIMQYHRLFVYDIISQNVIGSHLPFKHASFMRWLNHEIFLIQGFQKEGDPLAWFGVCVNKPNEPFMILDPIHVDGINPLPDSDPSMSIAVGPTGIRIIKWKETNADDPAPVIPQVNQQHHHGHPAYGQAGAMIYHGQQVYQQAQPQLSEQMQKEMDLQSMMDSILNF